jgi:hypothetical protein
MQVRATPMALQQQLHGTLGRPGQIIFGIGSQPVSG